MSANGTSVMSEADARKIDLRIAASMEGKLCEGCPAPGASDTARCYDCPRREDRRNGR